MRSHRCRKPHRARIAKRSEKPPAWTRPHTRHQDRQHTRKHTGLIQAHPPHVVYTYNQPGHDLIQDTRTGNTHENIRVSHRHTHHMRCYIQPAGTRPRARHQDRQHARKHTGLTQTHPPHEVLHTTSWDTTTYKASGQATRTKTYGSHTDTPTT